MRGYVIAMLVRFACIILGVVITGPLMWICFAGAIFLPYFAVVFANTAGDSAQKKATQVEKRVAAVEAPAVKVEANDFKIVNLDG